MEQLADVVEHLAAGQRAGSRERPITQRGGGARWHPAARGGGGLARFATNALRFGGLATGVAAGTMLLRPSAAGATTGAMQFGAPNDAGAVITSLTSTNANDTLKVANTGAGGNALHGDLANTTTAASAVVGTTASTNSQSAGVFGSASDVSGSAVSVVGAGFNGGGVIGFTGARAPASVASSSSVRDRRSARRP